MAAVKRNSKRKKSRSKLRGKGTNTTGIAALDGDPRPRTKPPKASITVTKDLYIKNFYNVTIAIGRMKGITTFISDEEPTRKHPVIAKLLKQMRDSYS